MNPLSAFIRGLIRLYRWTVSPLQTFVFGPGCGCRYSPTCSQYADEAIRTHGMLRGFWLTLNRLLRCHPWGGCGHDPVPPRQAREFLPHASLRDRPVPANAR